MFPDSKLDHWKIKSMHMYASVILYVYLQKGVIN